MVALGKIAFDACLNRLRRNGSLASKSGLVFAHGARYTLPGGQILLCAYHPSLQNTNTGKLTEKMMLDVFKKAKKLASR